MNLLILQEVKMAIEQKMVGELRYFGNLLKSLLQPSKVTVIDRSLGEIVGHYKKEEVKTTSYGPLELAYLCLQPNQENREPVVIRREM